MRPVRLDIEGFTAFRDPVTVDFSGADLFALTGPTGSGKSSVIDALVFALYGSVPRLDQRMVAPVISLGRTEARIRFEFTVADESYTAVRVVRRTKTGASTREARLERTDDGEVLAGNEKELTLEVERLLGLGFEQFTTCVVLPQGEFMRLLHDKPSERQDLLVSLLDLGLYETLAHAAGRRATLAEQAALVAGRLLEKLAGASPEAEAAARDNLAALQSVRDDLASARPQLEALQQEEARDHGVAESASARARLLGAVVVPAGVAARSQEVSAAQAAVERAAGVEIAAERSVDQAVASREALPSRPELDRLLLAHEQRRRLDAGRSLLEAGLASARAAEALAVDTRHVAEESMAAAVELLEQVRWEHRAHELARRLVAGEPCPVCRQLVDALPDVAEVDAVEAAVAARSRAESALRRATTDLQVAERDRLAAETGLTVADDQAAGHDARLVDGPPPEQLEATMAEVVGAEEAVAAARSVDRRSRRATEQARRQLEGVADARAADRRTFDEARDRVATLEPPPVGHDDLVADWAALVEWACAMRPIEENAAEVAAQRAVAASAARKVLVEALAGRCAAAGVQPGSGDLFEAVADQVAHARATVARIVADMAEAVTHRAEVAEHTRSAAVARDLARHLSASHFEKWILDEALGRLVEGATGVLRDLSRGDYSLALDERSNFLVIDHRRADERRSARTLSGGETFLASLALALALADQIGQLATNGAARLESIFLDEGFGTLDPDTLDTVAVAIEELGSRGRTVGLISHVPELAERVPVRFDVAKGPLTSTIERVDG